MYTPPSPIHTDIIWIYDTHDEDTQASAIDRYGCFAAVAAQRLLLPANRPSHRRTYAYTYLEWQSVSRISAEIILWCTNDGHYMRFVRTWHLLLLSDINISVVILITQYFYHILTTTIFLVSCRVFHLKLMR